MAHRAVVKSLPGETNLTITLTLANKQRILNRHKDEPLEKPLARLQRLAAPASTTHHPRRQHEPFDPAALVHVALHAGSSMTDPPLNAATTSNEAAWLHGRLLRVGNATYDVVLNPPWVESLEVFGRPFVALPLWPVAQLHFAEEVACRWQWQRQSCGSSDWLDIPEASVRSYTPTTEDEGCALRVVCTPARTLHPTPAADARQKAGPTPLPRQRAQGANAYATAGASPRPDAAPAVPAAELTPPTAAADAKQRSIQLGDPFAAACIAAVGVLTAPLGAAPRLALAAAHPTASPEVRVLSYNILSDQYASTKIARDALAHCPLQYRDPGYRGPMVLAELLGFRPDVACLQEVDEKLFHLYLQPLLAGAGYQGRYTNKAGRVREGCATFWRTHRFTLAAHREVVLRTLFPAQYGEASKYGATFDPMLATSTALVDALQRVATVAQLTLLLPAGAGSDTAPTETACMTGAAGDAPTCVVNTHLFFNEAAPHIRTMHTWAIMQEAAEFIREQQLESGQCAELPMQLEQQASVQPDDKQEVKRALQVVRKWEHGHQQERDGQLQGGRRHRQDQLDQQEGQHQQWLEPQQEQQHQQRHESQEEQQQQALPSHHALQAGQPALEGERQPGPHAHQPGRTSQQPAIIVSGDMNCGLHRGVPGALELLRSGRLPSDHWDWEVGAGFQYGSLRGDDECNEGGPGQEGEHAVGVADAEAAGGEGRSRATPAAPVGRAASAVPGKAAGSRSTAVEAATVQEQAEGAENLGHEHPDGGAAGAQGAVVAGVELAISFHLDPADGLRSEFTHYVKGFQGLLDHVWRVLYDPARMEVARQFPLPSVQELGGYLPNRRFPSDHLPVVFDLRFRAETTVDPEEGGDLRFQGETTVDPEEGGAR